MGPTFTLAVRLRARQTALSAVGVAAVIVMVGALFPSVGGSIGKLDVPEGVASLLGGADYGTLVGWMRSEIGAVYGPLVIAATAITAAAASTAGEEEDGVLGVVLSHPIQRTRLVLEKGAAVAVGVLGIALGTWIGLLIGVAVAGGGIGVGKQVALVVHLAFFGLSTGAVALALAAATGRRAVAAGGAAAVALLGYLVSGFAPLVDSLEWLKYLSLFHYYDGHDPLGTGIDVGDLVVLGAVTAVLTAVAVLGFRRRDLRG